MWEGMAGDAGRLASVSDQAWQVQTGVKEVGPQGLWEGSSGLPEGALDEQMGPGDWASQGAGVGGEGMGEPGRGLG